MNPTRLSLVISFSVAGCMTGPTNGQSIGTAGTIGANLFYQGYHNQPNVPVEIQVLADANADPTVAANWTHLATTTTGTAPLSWHDPTPLYAWSVNAAPVPRPVSIRQFIPVARWPQGGLARLRAVAHDSGGDTLLRSFDEDFSDCFNENFSASWEVLGQKCASPYWPVANIISASPTPADSFAGHTIPQWLERPGHDTAQETDAYYQQIKAPTSLAQFMGLYGFNAHNADEAHAIFYNDGDLGLGRDMRCISQGNGGKACMVTNYGTDAAGNAVFGGDPDTALAQTLAGTRPIATVAMLYDPPIDALNAIKFIVYDGAGNLLNRAKLDSTGNNLSIPNNCLTCHGGHLNAATNWKVSGAHFLPFDPFTLKFSSQPGWTYSDQSEALRRLNVHVLGTSPTPGILELVKGMYAPAAPTSPGAQANDTFVPAGWTDSDAHTKLYRTVVKDYCRSCHLAQSGAQGPLSPTLLNFTSSAAFLQFKSVIATDVCSAHQMPHAEHTMRKMWASSARAHLVGALGIASACSPQ